MIDYDSAMKHHLGNISRQVGHDVSNRYSYIVNQDDLTNAWLQMHNDLGYPLMVDSKYRRAIVYNKEGLEKQIQKMIAECIQASSKELADMVATDTVNEIAAQLNSLTQAANGQIVIGKTGGGSNRSSGAANRFAAALGRNLVKGFFKLIDDITEPTDKRRR